MLKNIVIRKGFCACGCGQRTCQVKAAICRQGYKKGDYLKFVHGHSNKGKHNPNWKGGKSTTRDGYILINVPKEHPRATKDFRCVPEQVLVSEKALGKYIPKSAVVHHINSNKSDNRPENLILCENNDYHMLLHRRMRSFKMCGHASWRKCWVCKQYDAPENLIIHPTNKRVAPYHTECLSQYGKLKWRQKTK